VVRRTLLEKIRGNVLDRCGANGGDCQRRTAERRALPRVLYETISSLLEIATMDQRDQELLEKQLRAINPAPRHDGVIIVTVLVGFLAGMTLGGFLVGHTSEPMRVASNDVIFV
jgi:hypothetical protein